MERRRQQQPAPAVPVRTRAPQGEPEQGHPPRLVELQRAAGNRAVLGMLSALQREDDLDGASEEAPDRPLETAQVADAIRFYTAQPWRYTPDLMAQIQAAVGVEPTGAADEATVQAVARWQRDQGDQEPELVIDGKAGPRTLPRLFRSGLNVAATAERFGQEAQVGVIDRWGELTPRQRAEELVRLVNVHLGNAGVPAVTPNATDTGNNAGQFDFGPWQMDIGLEALEAEQLTRDEAAEIVDTIYHEARHAEQWFRMAQMLAGRGRTARQIMSDLELDRADVADAARAAPLARGSMEALIAEGWHESVYGSGSAHRERTLGELDAAATALREAQAAFDADPSPENTAALEAARTRDQAAFDAYRELPEENDAWATGPLTGPGVTSGSPEPAAEEEQTEVEADGATDGGESDLGPLADELGRLIQQLTGGVPPADGGAPQPEVVP